MGAGAVAGPRAQQPAPGPVSVSGPIRKLPASASALDFFQLFVPDNVLGGMVAQTNMYARKFQERFGGDGAWAEVTLAEMKAFLGYVISTSTSRCESALGVWGRGFYSDGSLGRAMSQARFEKILKYFHVVAFRPGPSPPGLYKVQPFLDALQAGFDAAFRPSQTQVRPHCPPHPGAPGRAPSRLGGRVAPQSPLLFPILSAALTPRGREEVVTAQATDGSGSAASSPWTRRVCAPRSRAHAAPAACAPACRARWPGRDAGRALAGASPSGGPRRTLGPAGS